VVVASPLSGCMEKKSFFSHNSPALAANGDKLI
jgi:hypothetical protein